MNAGVRNHLEFWTDERTEQLRKLWAAGASASVIAAKIPGTTRSGICGKARRLGLAMRDARKRNGAVVEAEPLPTEPVEDSEIPVAQRRSVLDLNDKTCRWPVGDPCAPDFFFCGAVAAVGKPYCAFHSSVAYQPGGPRKLVIRFGALR